MYPYLGDFAAGSSIFVPFHTFNSSGASVTLTGLAVTDIEVYKGASMTQRASDAGFALVDTDGIDLDGVTGIHGFTIDTSDNTDSGFYAAGNDYTVVVSSVTVDSQTVNFIAARFSIENRVSNVTKWSGTAVATPDTAGYPKVTLKSGSGTGEVSLTSGGVVLSTSGVNAVADQVWDEAMSGHVAGGSFGAAAQALHSGTMQAGSAGTTAVLASGASSSNDYYNNSLLVIVSGTGAGQSQYISDYTGASRTCTMNGTWVTTPDNTSVYAILPGGTIPGASAPSAADNAAAVWNALVASYTAAGSFGERLQPIRRNTAQAGAAGSITLDASASATTDFYKYQQVYLISGTGAGQARQITAYNGTTKVATVDPAWTTAPDNTSVFMLLPLGIDAATLVQIADAVWDEARSGHATAGTFGEFVNANVEQISGDATAAANAEAFFDGTGYAGTNNVIPLVTTVTTLTGHTPQTGDTFARLGAPAGASVSADVAAIKSDTAATLVDTNELQTDITNGGRVDLLIDAIKAKTDSLTFTKAGEVDANIQSINGTTVNGDGSGTPWGP